jgi:hypothetical protein
MKKCSKCKVVKELNHFGKDKHNPTGYTCRCKSCKKEDRQIQKEYFKNYRELNREKSKKESKEYRDKNKKTLRARYLEKLTEEKIKKKNDYSKDYQKKNKDKLKNYRKEYVKNNEEKVREYQKKYREKNKDKRKGKYWNYVKNREKNDSLFKLKRGVIGLIYKSIKGRGYTKNSKTYELLGCDFETFKKHIESKFQEGMTWENKGKDGWVIDHIHPNSLCKTEEELLKNQHYTNLQPLWEKENLIKSNKIM